MSSELKPCPFCGGDAELNVLDGDAAGSTKLYAIDCSELDCGALMSAQHDREVAIQRWNRRSPTGGQMDE